MVPLAGCDVWRIARAQRLDPALFVAQHPENPEEEPSPSGFLLRPNGPTAVLALQYQPSRRRERPCIFLMKLRGGYQRCGIYDERPLACQAYPLLLEDNSVTMRDDMICPNGSWAGPGLDTAGWHTWLTRSEQEWRTYEAVVARWNEDVRQGAYGATADLRRFLDYLLNVYDARSADTDNP
jgi:Fe-S-cluster containining protein